MISVLSFPLKIKGEWNIYTAVLGIEQQSQLPTRSRRLRLLLDLCSASATQQAKQQPAKRPSCGASTCSLAGLPRIEIFTGLRYLTTLWTTSKEEDAGNSAGWQWFILAWCSQCKCTRQSCTSKFPLNKHKLFLSPPIHFLSSSYFIHVVHCWFIVACAVAQAVLHSALSIS